MQCCGVIGGREECLGVAGGTSGLQNGYKALKKATGRVACKLLSKLAREKEREGVLQAKGRACTVARRALPSFTPTKDKDGIDRGR